MIIALMLFVSCNNSTPTKEESNSSSTDSSNDSTPTVTVRDAADADYTLFSTLFNVLKDDLGRREDFPEGCTPDQDGDTFILTFNSCEFDSYNLDGSPLHVKLNGNATIRTEGEQENSVGYYTCNFTEGSSLGDTKFTANLEFDTNNAEMDYIFTVAIINGSKVKGLSELVKIKAIREATPADVKLTGLIYSAIGQINKNNPPTNVQPDGNTLNFIGEGYTVDVQIQNETVSVTLVGSATIEGDNITCDLKAGTVIADAHHTVKAELTITTISTGSSAPTMKFDVQEAIIDGKKVNNLTEKFNADPNSPSE